MGDPMSVSSHELMDSRNHNLSNGSSRKPGEYSIHIIRFCHALLYVKTPFIAHFPPTALMTVMGFVIMTGIGVEFTFLVLLSFWCVSVITTDGNNNDIRQIVEDIIHFPGKSRNSPHV